MRRIPFKCSLTTPQLTAFVFFCQALDEQLFDLSDDSYKAPSLNTFTRTLELESIARINHQAGISKNALQPFIEELEWSVSRDPALTPQQRQIAKIHIESIKSPGRELDRIARGVSGLRIVFGDYLGSIQSAIASTIDSRSNAKADLFDLAASFIIQAELEGYPRRHTYHVAQNSLITPLRHEPSINPGELLERFFSKFSGRVFKHDCLFIVGGDPQRYPKVLHAFQFKRLSAAPTWPGLTAQHRLFVESKKDDQHYLVMSGVQGTCAVGAHELATAMFEEFASAVQYEDHRANFDLSKLALIREDSSGTIYATHAGPDPMHCWTGAHRRGEADIVHLVEALHGHHLQTESRLRLRRSVVFHRNALLSNSRENQLIDLWAALEGLLPSPSKDSLRIEHFSETLLPALTLTYPEKLFTSALSDVLRVTPSAKPIIDAVPDGKTRFSKFVRIVTCPAYSSSRDRMLEVLKGHPLLMNKVWKLAQAFSTRNATQSTLKTHRKRLKWHLARIYFTRNSIIHNARSLPHLRTLVENLHYYVDSLIRAVARVAIIATEPMTVEGAMQYMSAWECHRLKNLSAGGAAGEAPLNDSDVWGVVFGDAMALAPPQDAELPLQI